MFIGARIREIRQEKNLSQGDLQRRVGLHRCYISRVEAGRSVPSVDQLYRIAAGLGVRAFELLWDGKGAPPVPLAINHEKNDDSVSKPYMAAMVPLLSKMSDSDRRMLMRCAKAFTYR